MLQLRHRISIKEIVNLIYESMELPIEDKSYSKKSYVYSDWLIETKICFLANKMKINYIYNCTSQLG